MKFLFFLLLATLALVSAHVAITPNQIPSGATTIINFQLTHGCNATTLTNKVVVMFPQNITNMKPIDKVGWKLSRTSELLGYKVNGVDAFYYNFTWEVDPSIYQGLPDWAYDVLQVRVTVPAATAIAFGSKFTVPVWQYCTGGLVYAWISGSSSGDSHGAIPVNGVTVSTAPTFTVLNPADIQFIPSQANVKFLSDRITNLTAQVSAFQSRIITSPHNGEDHGVAVTVNTNGNSTTSNNNNTAAGVINHYMDLTSADQRAEALSIIAIVLASISTTFMLILGYKYHLVASKNAKLLATAGTTTAPGIYTKDVELQPQQQPLQQQHQQQPGEPEPVPAAASAPVFAPAPVTDERRNTSTPSTQHEGEAGTHADDAHMITFHA